MHIVLLRAELNCNDRTVIWRRRKKLTGKIAESFFEKFEEIEHINTKEELKALHEGIEDGTEPEEKKEKTELHEQKRKLERDLLKKLMEIGGVNK